METKQQIVKKSAELFMRYGIKSVTMDDIARDLGISKKTLYQFVANKQDLIEQIFQSKIQVEMQIMRNIRGESTDAIDEILNIAKYVIRELRQLSPTVMYDLRKYYNKTWQQMEQLHQAHIYRIILENIERGVQEGLYRRDMNPDIIAKLYVAKTSQVVDQDLFPIAKYNVEELFRQYIIYHIHGVASPAGLERMEQHLDSTLEIID